MTADPSTHAEHVALLRASLRRLTGRDLAPGIDDPLAAAAHVWAAPYAVVSHDTAEDPVFNYGNRKALELFEVTWDQLTAMPSRLSAEPVHRGERARMFSRVAAHGFIDDYAGVRVSAAGRRFRIEAATVWKVVDDAGVCRGQAAWFDTWTPVR